MSTISLYHDDPASYERIQMLRPDYRLAKSVLLELALKYLGDKKDIILADFCCGTGLNSKMFAERLSVAKALLIDHNKEFIEIATNAGINARVEAKVGDILQVELMCCADAVLSIFAYHHMTDETKIAYLEKVKDALVRGGLLFLSEIYMPDKKTTQMYYDHIYKAATSQNEELHEFLMQTAASDDYEYKVTKKFADAQLGEAGFELLESRKTWPKHDEFGPEVGTYVEVWRVK